MLLFSFIKTCHSKNFIVSQGNHIILFIKYSFHSICVLKTITSHLLGSVNDQKKGIFK